MTQHLAVHPSHGLAVRERLGLAVGKFSHSADWSVVVSNGIRTAMGLDLNYLFPRRRGSRPVTDRDTGLGDDADDRHDLWLAQQVRKIIMEAEELDPEMAATLAEVNDREDPRSGAALTSLPFDDDMEDLPRHPLPASEVRRWFR